MKLNEIIKVPPLPDHGIKFSSVDVEHGTEMFTVDGYPVYQYHEKHGGSMRLFVLRIDDEDAAYVAHGYITIRGQSYPFLTRAFTAPRFQGNGYALKIIMQLRKLYNSKMLSDQNLTPDGIKLWKRLAAVLSVKLYDFTTGAVLDINDVPEDELYTDEEHNRHVFIIEKQSELFDEQPMTERVSEGIHQSYAAMLVERDVMLSRF